METRVALISIIVENNDVIDDINRFLHEAGKYIIGRMGIPYREKGISIISIAIDAPQDVISCLIRKDRPPQWSFRQNGIFQCDYKSGGQKMIKSSGIRKGRHRKIYYGFQCGSSPCGKGNESDADRL